MPGSIFKKRSLIQLPRLVVCPIFMKATIFTQGHQYIVEPGDTLKVDQFVTHCKGEEDAVVSPGTVVAIDKILTVGSGDEFRIGSPYLDNVTVEAEIIEVFKDKKVFIFKKKRRKGYERRRGHRSRVCLVKINKIIVDGVAYEADTDTITASPDADPTNEASISNEEPATVSAE